LAVVVFLDADSASHASMATASLSSEIDIAGAHRYASRTFRRTTRDKAGSRPSRPRLGQHGHGQQAPGAMTWDGAVAFSQVKAR
jgi:hypothetical protein